MAPAIGIDLGTVYSCVAVYRHGCVDIITNGQGNRITPSIVAFTQTKRLVGDAAKNQLEQNYANTIYDAKRVIGQKFNTIPVYDMKRWPFKVIEDEEKPKFEVTSRKKTKTFTPEEISAAVLIEMKEIAEAFLDDAVTHAVITVPAHFNDSQRQATLNAATIAELTVLQLINEPTAAAVAYGLKEKLTDEQNILVFDMGGGTFDVSVLTIDGEVSQVEAVGGDTHLGGGDFNNRMLDHFMKEIKQIHGVDLLTNKAAISRLMKECEIAKIALSTYPTAFIKIKGLFDGNDFNSSITRATFENINADFFDKAIEIVEKTLVDAKLTKDEIHEVVLVGGSTYIPKVQKMLRTCFDGKELNKSIKPDEAVAYGAAIHASILHGDDNENLNLVLLDITPMSLGVEVTGQIMNKIIERNTAIPIKKSIPYTTVENDQKGITFKVYEGEYDDSEANNLLGTFTLTGIPPGPKGVPKVTVTMEINADGILKVHAKCLSNGVESNITIQEYKSRMSGEEIEDAKVNEKLSSSRPPSYPPPPLPNE